MHPWEKITAALHEAGWSYGDVSLAGALDGLRQVDASKDGIRHIARAPSLMQCFQMLALECLVPEEVELIRPGRAPSRRSP